MTLELGEVVMHSSETLSLEGKGSLEEYILPIATNRSVLRVHMCPDTTFVGQGIPTRFPS